MAKLRELEAHITELEHQVHLFQRISRYTARDVSVPEVLQSIVDLVAGYMESESCLLYLLDSDELILFASSKPNPDAIGKIRLKLSEGLTGWVARERRLLAISREAYKDPRFKFFGDLPEDTFESFLSAPIIARNRVLGVINVQHRFPHAHTGHQMEVLTTIGEQVGCLLVLSRTPESLLDSHKLTDLALSGGPVTPGV